MGRKRVRKPSIGVLSCVYHLDAAMIKLGSTARHVRESLALKQREVADALGISVVHLCNIENDKSFPSQAIIDRYRQLWGIDLYVLAWCLNGDVERLPPATRKPAAALANAWKKQIAAIVKRRRPGAAVTE